MKYIEKLTGFTFCQLNIIIGTSYMPMIYRPRLPTAVVAVTRRIYYIRV